MKSVFCAIASCCALGLVAAGPQQGPVALKPDVVNPVIECFIRERAN